MTVRELLELLATADPDALVVLSKDAEGNGYSPLRVADDCRYEAESPVRGVVDHPDEPWPAARGVSAVGLWPAN